MLFLVTGTPGAGKTLNTIKFVNEDKQFEGRQIYYHGIKDLAEDFGWIELTEEEALKWYELPSDSVLLFDEAYGVFPTRHSAKKPPEHVERLATHRHQGFDIVLIMQKVTGQIDPFISGLVGRHQHYARIMGTANVNRFQWDVVQNNPNSASVRKDAITKPMRLDKKYFGSYHSADTHTHRASLPMGKFILFAVAVFLAIGATYYAFHRLLPEDAQQSQIASTSSSDPAHSFLPSSNSKQELTYSELYTPQVKGLPWSAPAYKEVITPVTYPKPNCVYMPSRNRCSCYSQQATYMNVPFDICLLIVDNGFFDVTKEDSQPQGFERPQERAQSPSAATQSRSQATF